MAVLRAILLTAFVLLACRAHAMTFDVYLQITPSQGPAPGGDAADPVYSGWIEVLGFFPAQWDPKLGIHVT